MWVSEACGWLLRNFQFISWGALCVCVCLCERRTVRRWAMSHSQLDRRLLTGGRPAAGSHLTSITTSFLKLRNVTVPCYNEQAFPKKAPLLIYSLKLYNVQSLKVTCYSLALVCYHYIYFYLSLMSDTNLWLTLSFASLTSCFSFFSVYTDFNSHNQDILTLTIAKFWSPLVERRPNVEKRVGFPKGRKQTH